MAAIRPLFTKLNRQDRQHFIGELKAVRAALPSNSPVAPDEVLEKVREAVNWFFATLKINSFVATPKDVANHLAIVDRRARKYRETGKPEWKQKLVQALRPPDTERPGFDLAALVAIEHLAVAALQHRMGGLPVPHADMRGRALSALQGLDLDHDGTLSWLAHWARKQRALVLEDQDSTATRLARLEGMELIEGRKFRFRPDPIKAKSPGKKTESDELNEFVGQLCVIYRWSGGSAAHDGRTPTPFQAFLEALEKDCPELGRHGSLQSRARRVLKEEQLGKRILGFELHDDRP